MPRMGAALKEPNRSKGHQPKIPEISSFIRLRVNAACTPDVPWLSLQRRLEQTSRSAMLQQ